MGFFGCGYSLRDSSAYRHVTHSERFKRLYGGWGTLFLRDVRSRLRVNSQPTHSS
ncbi:hypothetical protein NG799_18815 [Laspinema sp. D1]|uniref:Uncharacterized protein n=1 Tax=Laspinema palackyanum D2a TaxID=2953684 RepID=A0ABT2MUF4_9CYAN|nr:hypothetical protein [Laspinema sp. D2a]